MKQFISFLFLLFTIKTASGQASAFTGQEARQHTPVAPGTSVYKARLGITCNSEFRRVDGVCSSGTNGLSQLFGSSDRAQFSYFNNAGTSNPRGGNLKSARLISNIIADQEGNSMDERGLNDLTTIFGQFLDHTLVATAASKPAEPFDIPIPEGEKLPTFTDHLPFVRSNRTRRRTRDNQEGPVNSLTAIADLSNVYGSSIVRNRALRTLKDGLMKTSGNGKYMPMNCKVQGKECFANAPTNSSKFFIAGDLRSNEHPLLAALHTVFLREHNKIAVDLKARFPKWNDELLFNNTRKVNEAQWQKIVFEEWYPAITGRKLRRYTGLKNVDPTVSTTFSTAAFRVGHTLVNNVVPRRGRNNAKMSSIPFTRAYFRPASDFLRTGVDPFIRGAVFSRAQKVDTQVVDALRNFLYHKVEGESDNFDLIALNIQRGRDHGLLSYNAIRNRFRKGAGRGKANKFSDITSDKKTQAKLKEAYGEVALVEAWPGLMAEDHENGSSFGPTLLSIWNQEFLRLRDGDRFFFRRAGQFSRELMKLPRLQAVFRGDDIFKAIILRNSDIPASDLPKNLFFTK